MVHPHSNIPRALHAVTVALTLGLCGQARAQTMPPDYRYDQESYTTRDNEIIDYTRGTSPVDRRLKYDALAMQGVVFPTAFIPQDPTFVYRNHLFLGHQLSWGAWERLLVTLGTTTLPESDLVGQDIDGQLQASVTLGLWNSQDVHVVASGLVMERSARADNHSSEWGLGGHITADLAINDRLLLGLGVMGYRPVRATYARVDVSQCTSRADYINGPCSRGQRTGVDWPTGGTWAQVYAQLTYWGPRGFYGKLELNTGAVRGHVLNLEGAIWGNNAPVVQTRRMEAQTFRTGALYGAPLSAQFALGWTRGRFGGQVGLITLPAGNARTARFGREPEGLRRTYWVTLPVLSLALTL